MNASRVGRGDALEKAEAQGGGVQRRDPRGNLTGFGGAGYTFDVLNRMTRMVSGGQDWLFGYGADGERVVQVAAGGKGERRYTVRDAGSRVLREWVQAYAGSPIVWTRDWIHRGSQVLATVVPATPGLIGPPVGGSGAGFVDQAEGESSATIETASVAPEDTTLHLSLDHLGAPRLVTNAIGERKAFHTYWPYGREATDALQDELRLKFTGHERDRYDPASTADDLDYMHARFNSPLTGRFLSVDRAASWSLAATQSWNRYSYALASPLAYLDPDGNVVTYASEFLESVVVELAMTNPAVAETLTYYSGDLNLYIAEGDAGSEGENEFAGSFSVTPSPQAAGYEGNYEAMAAYAAKGGDPTYAATPEFITSFQWNNDAQIVLGAGWTADTLVHELGHADQLARDPVQYAKDTHPKTIEGAKTYESRPAEQYAQNYARRTKVSPALRERLMKMRSARRALKGLAGLVSSGDFYHFGSSR